MVFLKLEVLEPGLRSQTLNKKEEIKKLQPLASLKGGTPITPHTSTVQEYLSKTEAGMYLADNHAKMVWQGNKELIVKSINYRNSSGKRFYLISSNFCYGVIKIRDIRPISLSVFRKLEGKHRITEKERKEWWSNKKTLFAYTFDFNKFEEPRRVAIPSGMQTFTNKVEFLVEDAKPGKLLTEHIPQFSNQFKDAVIIKDFISLVGSSVEKSKHNDIDLLVRLSKPNDYVKRAVETRLSKMVSLGKNLHFVYEGEGPHDTHIPLYDLVLVKRNSKLVEMAARKVVSLMNSFSPMKPGKRFYNVTGALDYMFGGAKDGAG